MIKSDRWIREACARPSPLIDPFVPRQTRTEYTRVISYGLSSFGYDIRLAADGFGVFSPIEANDIDPMNFDIASLVKPTMLHNDDGLPYYKIPPHGYALGVTMETFHIPRNVLALCVGKSTYARCGLIVNTTPLEPGWKGRLVLEMANSTNLPVRVYVQQGIAQVMFFESDEECETSYADRDGKYQNQTGLTTAKV